MKTHHLSNQIYIGSKQKVALYDLYESTNMTKRSEIVVFIHGYMGFKDWGCWNLVANYFVENGMSFAKFNLTHNGTTLENTLDFNDLDSFGLNTYSNELADISLFIAHLENTHQFSKIHLVGHSRGGGMAILAGKTPSVETITCWAPISSIENRFPKGEELEKWARSNVYYKLNGRTKQEMPHFYSQYDDFLKNKDKLDIEKSARKIGKPVLVIHGENDESVSVKEGKDLAEWSVGKFISISNTSHTFDSSHPWSEKLLPSALETVCKTTLSFIKSLKKRMDDKEKNERLSIITELIKLANVDKEIRDIEFEFLLAIASQLGVTKDEFKNLFESYIEFSPPKIEFDRIIQFQRLILLMNIDLEINSEELAYIKDLGIRMGLHPSATNEILKIMKNYPNGVVPPDKLIGVFRTFHN